MPSKEVDKLLVEDVLRLRFCRSSEEFFQGMEWVDDADVELEQLVATKCYEVWVGKFKQECAYIKVAGRRAHGESMDALVREVCVYKRLQPIQGVWVPRLLGFGFHPCGFFSALSPEGQPLKLPVPPELRQKALAALAAIHDLGIVHVDIDPKNYVFDKETGEVKAIDFAEAEMFHYESEKEEELRVLEGEFSYDPDRPYLASLAQRDPELYRRVVEEYSLPPSSRSSLVKDMLY